LAEYVIEVPPFNPKTTGADEILKIVELFETNLANRTSDE
jgi:hypothetical protein